MTLLLRWIDAGGRARSRVLRGSVGVGRAGDLRLDGPAVADHHATIDADRAPVVLSVVAPDAAVFVNGSFVRTSAIGPGDEIGFGDSRAAVLDAGRWARERTVPPPPDRPGAPATAPKVAVAALPPVARGRLPVRWVAAALAIVAAAAGIYALRGVKWRDRLDPSYLKTDDDVRLRLEQEIRDRERAERSLKESEKAVRDAEESRRAEERRKRAAVATADRLRAEAVAAKTPRSAAESPIDRALHSVVAISGRTADFRILGSGFFVTEEGHVLTNAHVVEPRADYEIRLRNGGRFEVDVDRIDRDADLAVLAVRRTGGAKMPVLALGSARDLRIGDTVYAAGSPLSASLSFSVTRGIVSADLRTFEGVRLVQHDAAINPGNSGGPLLDADGRVVGINTLKISGAAGIGFAIPIEVAEAHLKLWGVFP